MDELQLLARVEFLRRRAWDLAGGQSVWFAPNIPKKKLDRALYSYGSRAVAKASDVVALHDATPLGTVDQGFVLTTDVFIRSGSGRVEGFGIADIVNSEINQLKDAAGNTCFQLAVMSPTRTATFVDDHDLLLSLQVFTKALVRLSQPGLDQEEIRELALAALLGVHGRQLAPGKEVHLHPDIPPKKAEKAIKAYATNVNVDRIVALYDSTLLGTCDEGFLITDAGFHFRHGKGPTKSFFFEDLVDAGPTAPGYASSTLVRTAKGPLEFTVSELPPGPLMSFISDAVAARESGLTMQSDRIAVLEEMPDEIKLNYLLTIAAMTFADDRIIDQRELAELQVLAAQIRCPVTVRAQLRAFLSCPSPDATPFVDELDRCTPRGVERPLQMSLVKDLIRVARQTKQKDDAIHVSFIRGVAERYRISNDQIDLIVDACALDERILAGDTDDDKLKTTARGLAARAAAVGVPLTAVYFSGSVVGMSAAGMTSGLAALGMGGLLLSSMATGIGVAVLLGVAAYKGVQWATSGDETARRAKRELMLKEILLTHHRATCNLVEDVNYLAEQITQLAREAEIDRAMLQKLSAQLAAFNRAIGLVQDRRRPPEAA